MLQHKPCGYGRRGAALGLTNAKLTGRPNDSPGATLVAIANGVEVVMDGRIYIERVNAPFLASGGSGDDFSREDRARRYAGWLGRHESGPM
jgi:hypothetical protein